MAACLLLFMLCHMHNSVYSAMPGMPMYICLYHTSSYLIACGSGEGARTIRQDRKDFMCFCLTCHSTTPHPFHNHLPTLYHLRTCHSFPYSYPHAGCITWRFLYAHLYAHDPMLPSHTAPYLLPRDIRARAGNMGIKRCHTTAGDGAAHHYHMPRVPLPAWRYACAISSASLLHTALLPLACCALHTCRLPHQRRTTVPAPPPLSCSTLPAPAASNAHSFCQLSRSLWLLRA